MQHESKLRLTEMLTRTGHVLAVEDFDDLAEIDRLAALVADPQSGVDAPLCNHAVFVRGVPVYPLTLAHLAYLDDAPAALDLKPRDEHALMLWAVTLPEITDEHYDPSNARAQLLSWMKHSRWTQSDIEGVLDLRYGRIADASTAAGGKSLSAFLDALDGALDDAESDTDALKAVRGAITDARKPSGGKDHPGALVALLAREYGGTPEYWERRASISVIQATVADWNASQEAQAKSYRPAKGASPVAPPPSPKFVTSRKLREACERVEAKWTAQSTREIEAPNGAA